MRGDDYYKAYMMKADGSYSDLEQDAAIDRAFGVDTGAADELERLDKALNPTAHDLEERLDKAFGLR